MSSTNSFLLSLIFLSFVLFIHQLSPPNNLFLLLLNICYVRFIKNMKKILIYLASIIIFFFPKALSSCRSEFLSYTTSFNTSCNASLLVTHSLSFCLSVKIFISPAVLEHNFTGFRILGWLDFFF